MKRGLTLIMFISLLISFCITSGFAETKITFMNSKGEIQEQLEDAAKLFEKENPGITLELLAAPVGTSPWEKVMALYAAGNAPTLFMDKATAIIKIKEKLADLSNEKWVKDFAKIGTIELGKVDGKMLAFPFAVEGMGLIYNKAVLDKVKIDPASIKTIRDLESAFKKIQAAGLGAVTILPADWSLGGHFLYTSYAYTENQSNWNKLVADLKAGKVIMSKNKGVSGIFTTFDLLKKYNINAKDPMGITQEAVDLQFTTGKAAFMFQGNWEWPALAKLTSDKNFGIIPVPISNNPKDYANNGIPAGITKFIGIDTTQNTKEQQDAAKKFLDWLVYSKSGQDILVNKCNIVPAFKNITLEPQDPLAKSLKGYLNKDQAVFWPLDTPSDHWRKLGPIVQKYLANVIKKDELFKEIETYWKNIK